MARSAVGLGVTGLFVVFLVTLLVLPYVQHFFPTVSGFEDIPTDLTCEMGLKPCPEGYFCEQRTCIPILPRYNINKVTGIVE